MSTVTPYRDPLNPYIGTGMGVLAPGTILGSGGYTNPSSVIGTSTSPGVYQNPNITANDAGGGGSTYTAPDYSTINASTIAQLSQGAGVIQNGINRLPGQLGIAQDNIRTQFGQKDSELNSGHNAAQTNYNTSTVQNKQNFRSNKNVINDQGANGLSGLQRLLGSYGAVGSDLGLAGRAVSDQMSEQNAGAGQNFSQNQQGLDTNWGNYGEAFGNEKKKLADWQTGQLSQAEAQSLSTKQDLLTKLADINGQTAAARGGSYAGSAQPYLDQANALSGQIDNLGRLNPTYDGTTPVYNAPTLSSYDTGNGAAIGGQGDGNAATPDWLNILLGRDKKQPAFA